jgi:hypothetical protein
MFNLKNLRIFFNAYDIEIMYNFTLKIIATKNMNLISYLRE